VSDRLHHSRPLDRVYAALEITLCSGFPTQIALIYLFRLAGWSVLDGQLSIGFVATLLILDAAVVIVLVVLLLHVHGESARQVFLGDRPIGREVLIGLPLTLVVFMIVIVMLTLAQRVAPWLRNVPDNPLEQLIRSKADAAMFAVVATFAGGLREEIQRAFILRRFDQHLGGARVGLVVFSVAFGAGHALQGWDAALTTGVLGAFWGAIYLARGSIVAPAVSHSGFNTAEILRFAVWGR
jgi:membrane protease YdiL (CAAX protease family)